MALGTVGTQPFERYERLAFVAPRPVKTGLGGEHRSRRRAPSTEFVDHRAYQPGDDFRRVDWNAYSRLGTLQVRLTEARERLDLVLVLDCSASMACHSGKLEFARDLVAALAYVGLGRHDLVRLVCLGERRGAQTIGPLRGRARFSEVVAALTQLEPDGRVPLAERLASCLPARVTGPPLVVLVSDLLVADGPAAGIDALLAAGGQVAVVHVVSPAELDPVTLGEVELLDAETGQTLELGLSLGVLARYRERFSGWLGQREQECISRGVRYLRVTTDRPLQAVLLDDLRRIGVLR